MNKAEDKSKEVKNTELTDDSLENVSGGGKRYLNENLKTNYNPPRRTPIKNTNTKNNKA